MVYKEYNLRAGVYKVQTFGTTHFKTGYHKGGRGVKIDCCHKGRRFKKAK